MVPMGFHGKTALSLLVTSCPLGRCAAESLVFVDIQCIFIAFSERSAGQYLTGAMPPEGSSDPFATSPAGS